MISSKRLLSDRNNEPSRIILQLEDKKMFLLFFSWESFFLMHSFFTFVKARIHAFRQCMEQK